MNRKGFYKVIAALGAAEGAKRRQKKDPPRSKADPDHPQSPQREYELV